MDIDPGSYEIVLQTINAVGTIGVLFFFVSSFMSGKLWPHKHVEEVIKRMEESNHDLSKKITDGIEAAVTKGIVLAIHEIRKTNGGSQSQQISAIHTEVLEALKDLKGSK